MNNLPITGFCDECAVIDECAGPQELFRSCRNSKEYLCVNCEFHEIMKEIDE